MVEIVSLGLKRLLNDWEDRRRGRAFPSRADFDPSDLKYILGNLSLVDVAYNPLRFRYRVYGTNLSERTGKEMTNKSVDDLPDATGAIRVKSHFIEVVESRAPTVFAGYHRFQDTGMPSDCEALMLPLSSDGAVIDMLMTAVVWDVEWPKAYLSPDHVPTRIIRLRESV